MAITWKSFALNEQITSSSATSRQVIYTASNGIGEINSATVWNASTTASADVSIYIKSDSTTSGTLTPVDTVSVGLSSSASIAKAVSHRVPASGTIQVSMSTTTQDCYITISGDERQQ